MSGLRTKSISVPGADPVQTTPVDTPTEEDKKSESTPESGSPYGRMSLAVSPGLC